jgi:uncharacterized protein
MLYSASNHTPNIFALRGMSALVAIKKSSRLRFNFGFLLEAGMGTSRNIEFDYPSIELEDDVILAPLRGTFQAIRNSKGIYLSGELHSIVSTECARCLDRVELEIVLVLDDLFYHPPQSAPPGEIAIGEDGFVDLAPLIRQLSLLEIPMQPICKPDCKGLCIACGQNLNESACDCEFDDIDPRLEALRALLEQ